MIIITDGKVCPSTCLLGHPSHMHFYLTAWRCRILRRALGPLVWRLVCEDDEREESFGTNGKGNCWFGMIFEGPWLLALKILLRLSLMVDLRLYNTILQRLAMIRYVEG